MSDFKAKMYHSQCRLGVRECTLLMRWRSLQRSLDPLAGLRYTSKGEDGKGKGRGMGREGDGKGGDGKASGGGEGTRSHSRSLLGVLRYNFRFILKSRSKS